MVITSAIECINKMFYDSDFADVLFVYYKMVDFYLFKNRFKKFFLT